MKANVTVKLCYASKAERKHSFEVIGADQQQVLLDARTNRRCSIAELPGQKDVPIRWDGELHLVDVVRFDGLSSL